MTINDFEDCVVHATTKHSILQKLSLYQNLSELSQCINKIAIMQIPCLYFSWPKEIGERADKNSVAMDSVDL